MTKQDNTEGNFFFNYLLNKLITLHIATGIFHSTGIITFLIL